MLNCSFFIQNVESAHKIWYAIAFHSGPKNVSPFKTANILCFLCCCWLWLLPVTERLLDPVYWSIYVHLVLFACTSYLSFYFAYRLLFHLCEGLCNISAILLNTFIIFGICLALHSKSKNGHILSVHESFLGECDIFYFFKLTNLLFLSIPSPLHLLSVSPHSF